MEYKQLVNKEYVKELESRGWKFDENFLYAELNKEYSTIWVDWGEAEYDIEIGSKESDYSGTVTSNTHIEFNDLELLYKIMKPIVDQIRKESQEDYELFIKTHEE